VTIDLPCLHNDRLSSCCLLLTGLTMVGFSLENTKSHRCSHCNFCFCLWANATQYDMRPIYLGPVTSRRKSAVSSSYKLIQDFCVRGPIDLQRSTARKSTVNGRVSGTAGAHSRGSTKQYGLYRDLYESNFV
jgi:hypothetical protein